MKSRFKFINIILTFLLLFYFNNYIVADSTVEDVREEYNLESYVESINRFVEEEGINEIDLKEISKSLFDGSSLDYGGVISKLLELLFKEVVITARGAITAFIIIVIMAIISSLELEKESDVTKIAHMACFLVLATVTISGFLEIIDVFKGVVNTLTTLMQTISPFIMGVLMATGAITSTGIIQPLILFLASLIGFIVNYIVIPFITISVAINVICSISDNIKLSRAAKFFNSSAIWIIGVSLTIFLGILSLETSISSSVDSLTVKTTQAAVSNFVPVVGKFFSDSFETVVGATKIINNIGGAIGIIGIILVSAMPLIKIGSTVIIYYLLNVLAEPLHPEGKVGEFILGMYNAYKSIFGILIGIVIIFVISTGIILNLSNAVIK